MIALGTCLSVVFGVHAEVTYTRDLLEELFVSIRVLAYLCGLLAFVALNILFFRQRSPGDMRRGLSLGITAGTIAGNMFCVKAVAELIKASIRDKSGEVWAHWLPWVILLGAIIFALSNLQFMERGMREYEALFMATLFEGSLIVSGCVSGIVVLREFDNLPVFQICSYFACISLIVAGITTLYKGESARAKAAMKSTAPIDSDAEPSAVVQVA